MKNSAAVQMIKPLPHVLFDSDLWEPALEKYAKATHVTLKLFDTDLRVVFGPIHPTAMFELFDRGGYDPGLFAECARQCLVQTTDRPAVTVSKIHGLAVIGTSLVLDGKIVGAAVAGYVLVDFSQLSEIQRVAKDARIDFGKVWQVAREQSPVSQRRLNVNGELLQVLGDALLRENARTRQYERAAWDLQETSRAKERAHEKLLQTASALRTSEERVEKELMIAQQLQSASSLIIEGAHSQRLYQRIVEAAVAIMGSDMASMQVLYPERGRGGELRLLASHGFEPEAAKAWEWVGTDSASSCAEALRSDRRVVVPDVETCDFLAGTEGQATYLRAGIRAAQSTPLCSRTGHLLGMISTHWRNPHTPTEHELRQFDVLARQAADLLEHEQAEAAIRASEGRYRTLFDLGPIAVYSCDASGVIRDYNHVAAELWGREPQPGDTDERWCGSFKMIRPDGTFMPHGQCPMADVVSGKIPEVRDGEVQIERPDGSRITVLVNIRPLKNERGEITGAINCFVEITERKKAEDILRESKRTLETRVRERTSELEGRNAEILAQAEQLQDLSLRLMRAQDEERRRIARELHDSLGQYLAYAKICLDASQRPGAKENEPHTIHEAAEALEKCIMETRTISHLLHPPLLDEIGLESAAKWYVEGFAERSGIYANVNIADAPERLTVALELALFRILQEALVNVHRHSHSDSVDIQLEFTAGEVTLQIRDHGQGMPPDLLERFRAKDKLGGGVGLRSMSGRIRELGGSFEIESDKEGTLIRVTAPIPGSPANTSSTIEKASAG